MFGQQCIGIKQTSSNVFPLSSASWILFAASVRGAMACRSQIIQFILLTELRTEPDHSTFTYTQQNFPIQLLIYVT